LEVAGSLGSVCPVKAKERQKCHRISWTLLSRLKQQTDGTIYRFRRRRERLPIWGEGQNVSPTWGPNFEHAYSTRRLPSADRYSTTKQKGKAIPLQASTGP
jgi:hypothetical protein